MASLPIPSQPLGGEGRTASESTRCQAVRRSAWSAGGPATIGPARLRAVDGGAGRLLTVREVAERLAVSTATVYALCERGKLRHVRISNAIRILPDVLESFVTAHQW